MLRINESRTGADDVRLALQGDVAGPWIGELTRAASTQMSARSLTLDLADVTFIDREAVAALRDLASRGVRVEGCTAFARALLKEICC